MKTIAVIFGGRSTEHDISILTALSSVIKPLELIGDYQVEPIYISKDGAWFWDDKLKDIKLFSSGEIDNFLKKAPKVQLQFDNGLVLVKSSQFAGRKMYRQVDIVFPAMHGTHGEDGQLMGLLEMANVPYVGCGMPASAIAMDKVLAKQVTQSFGIYSTPWIWFYAQDLPTQPKKILDDIAQLKYPLFVKPAHLGSSIGITKVDDPKQLMNALEVAAHYDDKVIVEQGVQNLIEVTLPIMGNHQPVPALLERPLTNPEDFFDFETKYLKGGGKKSGAAKTGGGKAGAQGYSQIPADLPKDLYAKAEKLALDVYKAVQCEGLARIDMLIDTQAGKVFFNEINPLPGSLYSHNWQKAGVSPVQLVTNLLDYAMERYERAQQKNTIFTTNYLKQF